MGFSNSSNIHSIFIKKRSILSKIQEIFVLLFFLDHLGFEILALNDATFSSAVHLLELSTVLLVN